MRIFADYREYINKSWKLTDKHKLIMDYIGECRKRTLSSFDSPIERGEFSPIVNGERYSYGTNHITALLRSAKQSLKQEKGTKIKWTNSKTNKLIEYAECVYKDMHNTTHVDSIFKPNELKYLVARYLTNYPNGTSPYVSIITTLYITASSALNTSNKSNLNVFKVMKANANESKANTNYMQNNDSESSASDTISYTSTDVTTNPCESSMGIGKSIDENDSYDFNKIELYNEEYVESNMDTVIDINSTGKEFFDSIENPFGYAPRNAFMERRENKFSAINLDFCSESESKLNMSELIIEYDHKDQQYYVQNAGGTFFRVINTKTINNCRTIYQLSNLEIYEIISFQTRNGKYSYNRSLMRPLKTQPTINLSYKKDYYKTNIRKDNRSSDKYV